MVTTTFPVRRTAINLPTAQAEKPNKTATVNVAVDAAGRYVVNGKLSSAEYGRFVDRVKAAAARRSIRW